jgi:hypothetical protein
MKKIYNINKDFLRFGYNICHYTIHELATFVGCNDWVVKDRMKLFKIKSRTTSEVVKERKSLAKDNNPAWKGGKDRFPKCLICNKRLTSLKAKYCSNHKGISIRKKLGKGKNHHSYIHGGKSINCKIKNYLRTRIWWAIKNNYKSKHTMQLLGCSIDFLKQHLSSKFTSGMSWSNYGKWHIDHIKPCAKFDLSKEEEQRKCFHYTNLQPLWAKDNLRKGCNGI